MNRETETSEQQIDDDSSTTVSTPPARRFSRYVLLHRIGSGAMGEVYAAYDSKIGRRVALKISKPRAPKERLIRRAVLESRAMASLVHPNVVTLFDFGEHEDQVFLAMEYIDGITLSERLEIDSNLSQKQIVGMFLQAGRGLAAIHEAELVHGDFKPSNVLVDRDGRVLVSDLGLSVSLPAETEEGAGIKTRGGTVGYMAPEVRDHGSADARSDQYSFAVSLWEALTGIRPMERESSTDDSLRHRRMGSGLRKALLRAMKRRPEDRFTSIDELMVKIDPRRRLGSTLWISGSTALVAAGIAGFLLASMGSLKCPSSRPLVAAIWSPDVSAEIQTAFSAAHPRLGPETHDQVSRRLEAYTSQWAMSREDACRATHVRREQAETMLGRRISCLDRRLDEVAAVTHRFRDADVATVLNAMEMLDTLRPLSRCSAEVLMAKTSGQEPAATDLARLREIARHLDALDLTIIAGDQIERERIEDVVTAAKGAESERLLMRAHLVAGRYLQQNESLYAEATQHFRTALWLAIETRDEAAEATIYAHMIETAALGPSGLDEAEPWLAFARASLAARSDNDDEAALALLSALGTAAWFAGDFEAAYRHTRELVEREVRMLGSNHLRVAKHKANLGIFAVDLPGREAEAAALLEEAVAIRTRHQGAEHPGLATVLHQLASVRNLMGQYREGLDLAVRAAEVVVVEYGSEHPRTVLPHLTQVEALIALDQPLRAGGLLARLRPLLLTIFGDSNTLTAYAEDFTAEIYLANLDPEQALSSFQKSDRIRRRTLPPEHAEHLIAHLGMARALLDLGRFREARDSLAKVSAIAERTRIFPRQHGLQLLSLARIAIATGSGFEETLTVLKEAQLAASDPHLWGEALLLRAEDAASEREARFAAACEAMTYLDPDGSPRTQKLRSRAEARRIEIGVGLARCPSPNT